MIEWLVAAAFLLLAALFIMFPLWAPGRAAQQRNQRVDLNRQLFHERLAELQDPAQRNGPSAQDLMIETQRQFLADQDQALTIRSVTPAGGGRLLMVITAAVLLLAVSLYGRLGALPDQHIRDLLHQSGSTGDFDLRDLLARRLEQKSNNLYYWLLLARVEVAAKNIPAAEAAYRRAWTLAPGDGTVAAELAQALFIKSGQRVNGEIESLVIQALKAEPDNGLALELAGIIAYANGDYSQTLVFWQRALALAEPDSEAAQALQAGIHRIGNMEGHGLGPQAVDEADISSPVLTVRVELDKNFTASGDLPGGATVYVYIREWQGSPMPLAAQRFTLAQLPLSVAFSEAMSLSETRKLSAVARWEVVARVALGGQLQASTGDLEGRMGPITGAPGQVVDLVIDRRLP